MVEVISTRYPELRIPSLGVKFRGGVAHVDDDPKVLADLASRDGIEVPEAAKKVPAKKTPAAAKAQSAPVSADADE